MFKLIVIAILALTTGCMNGPNFGSQSNVSNIKDGSEEKGVAAKILEESEGVIAAQFSASSDASQFLSASGDSAIDGAKISIPPNSLAINTTISMEEGGAIASGTMLQKMTGNDALSVTAATNTVLVTSTKPLDLSQPMTILISIPSSSGLVDNVNPALVIFYKVFKKSEDKWFAGYITRDKLKIVGSFVEFPTIHFGAFQAAILNREIKEPAKEVVMESSALSKKAEKTIPAITWGEYKLGFDSKDRTVSVSLQTSGYQELVTCELFGDTDQVAPYEIREKIENFSTKAQITFTRADTLVFSISCLEKSGRLSQSPWSQKLSIPEAPTIVKTNSPPAFAFTQAGANHTVATGGTYNITFNAVDTDSVASIALYYKDSSTGCSNGLSGWTEITKKIPEGTNSTYNWSTAGRTPGTYHICAVISDEEITAFAISPSPIKINAAPTLTLTSPPAAGSTIAESANFSITFNATDADDIATISLYSSSTNSGCSANISNDWQLKTSSLLEGTNTNHSFNHSAGLVYICGVIDDGVNPKVAALAPGFLRINAAPTISLSKPNAAGDSVKTGENYAIQFVISDPDDAATAALYYSSTSSTCAAGLTGWIGIATGLAETATSYVWNTSSMSPGTYYICGVATDPINGNRFAVSSGGVQIFSNAAPTIAITNLSTQTVIATGGIFNINFNAVDSDDAAKINIYYKTSATNCDSSLSGWTLLVENLIEGTHNSATFSSTGKAAGSYFICASINDDSNPVVYTASAGAIKINSIPTLAITSPSSTITVAENATESITFTAADPDDIAGIQLYRKSSQGMCSGNPINNGWIAIGGNLVEGTNTSFTFNPNQAMVAYICGVIDDGVNQKQYAESSGKIIFNDAPTITLSTPNNNTIVPGTPFNIAFSAVDSDSDAQVDLYYKNTSGGCASELIGWTPIAMGLSESTSSYLWNMGALSNGSFHVCARVRDGTNEDVYQLSPGTLTIGNSQPAFVSVWNHSNISVGSTPAYKIRLPLVVDGSYNFTVAWGDGSQDVITSFNQQQVEHTYTTAGIYTITIIGQISGWRFNGTGDRLKLLSITNWGPLKLGNAGAYFAGASNLAITATDTLDLAETTNLFAAFQGCSSLTGIPNINDWDTSDVTNMGQMFKGAHNFDSEIGLWNTSFVTYMHQMFAEAQMFNRNIGNWNTAAVTTMGSMFYGATIFNQDIGEWDTGSVVDMSQMFRFAQAFNQDIGNWDTANVTNMSNMFYSASSFNKDLKSNQSNQPWDTSSVTNMMGMFKNATAFNKDISDWNTNAVQNMSFMFKDATAFNQDISNWDVEEVTNMSDMLSFSNLSTENYDALLISWSKQNVKPNVTLGASGRKHSYGVAASARINLDTAANKNWILLDSGPNSAFPIAGGFEPHTQNSSSIYNINWTQSSGAGPIQYLLCEADHPNSIDTVPECLEAQIMGFQPQIYTYPVAFTPPTYYFNIVAKDYTGKKVIYNGYTLPSVN